MCSITGTVIEFRVRHSKRKLPVVQIVISILGIILAIYFWRILVLIVAWMVLFWAIGSLFGEPWSIALATVGLAAGLIVGIKDRMNPPIAAEDGCYPTNKKLVLNGFLSLAILAGTSIYNDQKVPKPGIWSKAASGAEWVVHLNPLGRAGKWFRKLQKR